MFSELISYANALESCWRRHTELDYFFREDVDEVVVFGRMDDAKLDLKKTGKIKYFCQFKTRLKAYPESFSLKGRSPTYDESCQTTANVQAFLIEYIE
jgi:hypothetical protein